MISDHIYDPNKRIDFKAWFPLGRYGILGRWSIRTKITLATQNTGGGGGGSRWPCGFHWVTGVIAVVSHFAGKVHILHHLKSKMAAFNSEFIPQAKLFILLALMRSRSQKINWGKHRFWVREIFKYRQKFGAYHTLYRWCIFMTESTSTGKIQLILCCHL